MMSSFKKEKLGNSFKILNDSVMGSVGSKTGPWFLNLFGKERFQTQELKLYEQVYSPSYRGSRRALEA